MKRGTDARAHEAYANERAWRKAGLSERYDRTDPSTSLRWGISREVERLYAPRKGGVGLEVYGDRVRPMAHRIYALRQWPDDVRRAMAAGLDILPVLRRYDGQQSGAVYDVLLIGPGVTSCKPGDRVVASSYVGRDLGDVLGDAVYELTCDVVGAVQDGDSDTERRCGGDVLAVLEA